MATKVITYGTFDMFHEGHRRLLERARELGDHLTVAVTSEDYDATRGKLNVQEGLMQRIEGVRRSGLADDIIVEEYEGQKLHDIQSREIDIFAIGSDWQGRFDYLSPYCQVVYLDRTKGISSTELRAERHGTIRMGVIGSGRIAARFVPESRFVSGVSVDVVYSPTLEHAQQFAAAHELDRACGSVEELFAAVDAVYIASPHGTHADYVRAAIAAGKHVLCEKPLALTADEASELFALAAEAKVVLAEAIKTAYAPGFRRMLAVAQGGSIGQVVSVEATFTKLLRAGREQQAPDGGAISELGSYVLLPMVKLFGTEPAAVRTTVFQPQGAEVEQFASIELRYPHGVGTARVGIGVKAEGELVIAGTEGYLYVPAPWWLTDYFELRFEDPGKRERYYVKFAGDGLRYEIGEFAAVIRSGALTSYMLRPEESIALAKMVETARSQHDSFGVE
ncbi:MAG: Gfo/Idh/MocA family oxidoreductase [Propionibacteriales bacterium]|nr:Gfo/Idh/MocA family oxidoreductase [Propionibacteriales bacterium]